MIDGLTTNLQVSDRETDRKGEDVSEERADSGHSSKSGARNENDGRPDERDTVDIDRFPARSKKRRALSVEERPSATEEESSLSDNSASDHNRMQEHPLQASVDTPAWPVLVRCTYTWEPKNIKNDVLPTSLFAPSKLPQQPIPCLPRLMHVWLCLSRASSLTTRMLPR